MARGKLKIQEDAKIVHFGIERYEVKKSIKEMYNNMSQYYVCDLIQRDECWDVKRKSLLLHSILIDLPVPSLFVQKMASKNSYNILDGKQRFTSVLGFLNGDYSLSKFTPPVTVRIETENGEEYQDINIGNKKFKQLPEQFQDKILSFFFTLEVMVIDDDKIKALIFDRLNNNKPLRPVEKIRASMDFDFLEWVGKTKQLPLFNYGDIDGNNKKNEDLLLQTLLLLRYDGDTGIGSKEIQFLAHSGLSEDEKTSIEEVIRYASNAISTIGDLAFVKRILLKQNKTSAFIFMAREAMDIPVDKYAQWAIRFFAEEKGLYDEFRQYAESGSGKRDRVQKRLQIAKEDLMRYINVSAD